MNKARYWKSTYVVTVLTEGPHPPRYGNMHELANDICTGEAVGSYVDEAVEISRDEMEALLQEQHVDPTFLIHEGGDT